MLQTLQGGGSYKLTGVIIVNVERNPRKISETHFVGGAIFQFKHPETLSATKP